MWVVVQQSAVGWEEMVGLLVLEVEVVLLEVLRGDQRPTSPLLLTLAPSLGAGRNIEYY